MGRVVSPSLTFSAVNPWLVWVTDGFATYRLTRLLAADTITATPRNWLVAKAYRKAGRDDQPQQSWTEYAVEDPDVPKAAAGLVCRFCWSMHCAAFAVLARRFAPKAWDLLARGLALSAVGALLAGLEDD